MQTISIIPLIFFPAVETSHFYTESSFLIQENKINDWYVGPFLVLPWLENKGPGPS